MNGTVLVGFGRRDVEFNVLGSNVFIPLRVIIHPEYEPDELFKNDIALLELEKHVTFTGKPLFFN